MKRGAPMKRSGFKRKPLQPQGRPERQRAPIGRLYRVCPVATISQVAAPIPKPLPVRHQGYLRLVAARPCIHCGAAGRSQAAHCDQGKGMGTKADDRLTFPLCATSPGAPGCHDIIGASGSMPKEDRRALEASYAAITRRAVRAEGLWPADLEPYPGDELLAA